jgi:hypothetical protein
LWLLFSNTCVFALLSVYIIAAAARDLAAASEVAESAKTKKAQEMDVDDFLDGGFKTFLEDSVSGSEDDAESGEDIAATADDGNLTDSDEEQAPGPKVRSLKRAAADEESSSDEGVCSGRSLCQRWSTAVWCCG